MYTLLKSHINAATERRKAGKEEGKKYRIHLKEEGTTRGNRKKQNVRRTKNKEEVKQNNSPEGRKGERS